MKKFQVFKHPDNRLIAVKDGFSVLGLIFGGFWLLWHQMWAYGCIALIVGLATYGIFPNPAGLFGMADLANLIICIFIGALGNEWQATSLGRRGFKRVATVNADTADGAKAKYLSNDFDYTF